jgi:imidazolonepropionase-like amidohydrolase
VRERWLGATGIRVPEIAVDGELELPDDVLWAEQASDDELRAAHAEGRPVAAHASSAEDVKAALARPEVACVLVPPERRDLLGIDLTKLTYG